MGKYAFLIRRQCQILEKFFSMRGNLCTLVCLGLAFIKMRKNYMYTHKNKGAFEEPGEPFGHMAPSTAPLFLCVYM